MIILVTNLWIKLLAKKKTRDEAVMELVRILTSEHKHIRFEGNNMNKPVYRELSPNQDGTFSPHDTKTGATYALKVFYKFTE